MLFGIGNVPGGCHNYFRSTTDSAINYFRYQTVPRKILIEAAQSFHINPRQNVV